MTAAWSFAPPQVRNRAEVRRANKEVRKQHEELEDSLSLMTREEKLELLQLLEEKQRRTDRRRIDTYFPDHGKLRRELYPQHLAFFKLGAACKTRAFMAANRVGKTEGGGGYELTCHLTGDYPSWWEGHRFDRAISAWVAGDTKETVRDIIQAKMLGAVGQIGTGLIPGDSILDMQKRPNGNGALDYVTVQHKSGGISRLGFKSYDQGREAFQGTEQDVIWLDEEANQGVREECVIRLMTTAGLLMETFTPLRGLTPIVLKYLGEGGQVPANRVAFDPDADRGMVMAGWDDVPHLRAEEKRRMLAECSPHQRASRSKGVPSLGSGAIYPVPEEDIVVDDFPIPDWWPRAYGMDVGWNKTAAIWGAHDLENDIVYLYSEHYRGQAEPSVHADAVKARGKWIPGSIDPASRGRGQIDGQQLMQMYVDLGLDLEKADNAVETGLYEVFQRLSTGRLKIFKSMSSTLGEYRIYRRDEKGRIVKANDHAMDALRYLIMSGLSRAKRKPIESTKKPAWMMGSGKSASGWKGA